MNRMVRLQLKAAAVIGADPNVEAYFSLVNAQGGPQGTGNSGRLQLRLKPRAERKLTPEQIIAELRPEAGSNSRHPNLSSESSADPHRRTADAHGVSVHPAGAGSG